MKSAHSKKVLQKEGKYKRKRELMENKRNYDQHHAHRRQINNSTKEKVVFEMKK